MNHILAIIITTGAACVSPLTADPGGVTVEKVECAKIVQYHSANPFKAVQQPNVVSVAKPKLVKAAE
jgi:hypothetical protein